MNTSPSDRANVWGSPGSRARAVGIMRVTWPILVLAALIGFTLGQALPIPGLSSTIAGVILLLLAGALFRALVWSRDRLANYIKGARGEEVVSRHLSMLPAGYNLYNSLHLGARPDQGTGDLDHVITGPNGIFVVETKNWSGVISSRSDGIYIDGKIASRSPTEQVQQEATVLREWIREAVSITLPVTPVLCFVDGRLSGGERNQVGPVEICTAETLVERITGHTDEPTHAGMLHRINEALQSHMKEQEGAFE